jgi:hypothetical protein
MADENDARRKKDRTRREEQNNRFEDQDRPTNQNNEADRRRPLIKKQDKHRQNAEENEESDQEMCDCETLHNEDMVCGCGLVRKPALDCGCGKPPMTECTGCDSRLDKYAPTCKCQPRMKWLCDCDKSHTGSQVCRTCRKTKEICPTCHQKYPAQQARPRETKPKKRKPEAKEPQAKKKAPTTKPPSDGMRRNATSTLSGRTQRHCRGCRCPRNDEHEEVTTLTSSAEDSTETNPAPTSIAEDRTEIEQTGASTTRRKVVVLKRNRISVAQLTKNPTQAEETKNEDKNEERNKQRGRRANEPPARASDRDDRRPEPTRAHSTTRRDNRRESTNQQNSTKRGRSRQRGGNGRQRDDGRDTKPRKIQPKVTPEKLEKAIDNYATFTMANCVCGQTSREALDIEDPDQEDVAEQLLQHFCEGTPTREAIKSLAACIRHQGAAKGPARAKYINMKKLCFDLGQDRPGQHTKLNSRTVHTEWHEHWHRCYRARAEALPKEATEVLFSVIRLSVAMHNIAQKRAIQVAAKDPRWLRLALFMIKNLDLTEHQKEETKLLFQMKFNKREYQYPMIADPNTPEAIEFCIGQGLPVIDAKPLDKIYWDADVKEMQHHALTKGRARTRKKLAEDNQQDKQAPSADEHHEQRGEEFSMLDSDQGAGTGEEPAEEADDDYELHDPNTASDGDGTESHTRERVLKDDDDDEDVENDEDAILMTSVNMAGYSSGNKQPDNYSSSLKLKLAAGEVRTYLKLTQQDTTHQRNYSRKLGGTGINADPTNTEIDSDEEPNFNLKDKLQRETSGQSGSRHQGPERKDNSPGAPRTEIPEKVSGTTRESRSRPQEPRETDRRNTDRTKGAPRENTKRRTHRRRKTRGSAQDRSEVYTLYVSSRNEPKQKDAYHDSASADLEETGFTLQRDRSQDELKDNTTNQYEDLAKRCLEILRREEKRDKEDNYKEQETRHFIPLIHQDNQNSLGERPWKRMTYMPTTKERTQKPFRALRTMLRDIRFAMNNRNLCALDISILASSGADDQPVHTDLAHTQNEYRRAGLKGHQIFAAIKNIHDEGTKSGTILIDGSNHHWTADGYDKDVLRRPGKATRITGDHTMTTYIDHRTLHYGEAVPNKRGDWKLTLYMLLIPIAIRSRFTKIHDTTQIQVPLHDRTMEIIEDRYEYITYDLQSNKIKQQETRMMVRLSWTFREIRKAIADTEGISEGLLQVQTNTGVIPELSQGLGEHVQPQNPIHTTTLIVLDTEGKTRRRVLIPVLREYPPKTIIINCMEDRSQTIKVQPRDTIDEIKGKIQDVILLPSGSWTATRRTKDLRTLEYPIYAHTEDGDELNINGRIMGSGRGSEEDSNDDDGEPDLEDEAQPERSPIRQNAFAVWNRRRKSERKDKDKTNKTKKKKSGRREAPIEQDKQTTTANSYSYNTACNLTYEGNEEEVKQELEIYMQTLYDHDHRSQKQRDRFPTSPQTRSVDFTSPYDLKMVISPKGAGRKGAHVMLRTTGTLCGTNMTQRNMYELRAVCNAIQRQLTRRSSKITRLELNEIVQQGSTLLKKARRKGTAPKPTEPASSEEETEPPNDRGQQDKQEGDFLKEFPCGNRGTSKRRKTNSCPSQIMHATFRCTECAQVVCEICREDNRHGNETPHCSRKTWETTPGRTAYSTNHILTGTTVMNRFNDQPMIGKTIGAYEDNGETWTLVEWDDGQETELDKDLHEDVQHAWTLYNNTGEEPDTDLLKGHLYSREERGTDTEKKRAQNVQEKRNRDNPVTGEQAQKDERKPARTEQSKESHPTTTRRKSMTRKEEQHTTPTKDMSGLQWLKTNITTDEGPKQTHKSVANRREDILVKAKVTKRIHKHITQEMNKWMRSPKNDKPMVRHIAELTHSMTDKNNREGPEKHLGDIREAASTIIMNAAHEATGEEAEDTIMRICKEAASKVDEGNWTKPPTPKRLKRKFTAKEESVGRETPQHKESPSAATKKQRPARKQQNRQKSTPPQQPQANTRKKATKMPPKQEDTCQQCQHKQTGGNFCQNCGQDQRQSTPGSTPAPSDLPRLEHLDMSELLDPGLNNLRQTALRSRPKRPANHKENEPAACSEEDENEAEEWERHWNKRGDEMMESLEQAQEMRQDTRDKQVRLAAKHRFSTSTIDVIEKPGQMEQDLRRMRWARSAGHANMNSRPHTDSCAVLCDYPLLYSDAGAWRLRNNWLSDYSSISALAQRMNSRQMNNRNHVHATLFCMTEDSTRVLDTDEEWDMQNSVIALLGKIQITSSNDEDEDCITILEYPTKVGTSQDDGGYDRLSCEYWETEPTPKRRLKVQIRPTTPTAVWLELRPKTNMRNKVCDTIKCAFSPCAFSNHGKTS